MFGDKETALPESVSSYWQTSRSLLKSCGFFFSCVMLKLVCCSLQGFFKVSLSSRWNNCWLWKCWEASGGACQGSSFKSSKTWKHPWNSLRPWQLLFWQTFYQWPSPVFELCWTDYPGISCHLACLSADVTWNSPIHFRGFSTVTFRKPWSRDAIMLYCTHSVKFWLGNWAGVVHSSKKKSMPEKLI